MRDFHPGKLVAFVLPLGPGPVDRVGSEARNDVPVAVVDRLTGGLADVDDHVESDSPGGCLDRAANPRQEGT